MHTPVYYSIFAEDLNRINMTIRERLQEFIELTNIRFNKKYELVETTWWAEIYEEGKNKSSAGCHIHTEDKELLLWGLIEALMTSAFIINEEDI